MYEGVFFILDAYEIHFLFKGIFSNHDENTVYTDNYMNLVLFLLSKGICGTILKCNLNVYLYTFIQYSHSLQFLFDQTPFYMLLSNFIAI